MPPLINILVRTSFRPEEFVRCINSIIEQTYKNVKVIVCTDKAKELYADGTYYDFIETVLENRGLRYYILPLISTGVPFHWNFYCNNLKDRVTDGWFMYLDDDDYLAGPDKLKSMALVLEVIDPGKGVICQFNRGTRAKPDFYKGDLYITDTGQVVPSSITRGKIGGSCIFLHHSQKDIANWDGKKAADYRFIRDVAAKIPLVFVPTVVVQAGNNGRHGR